MTKKVVYILFLFIATYTIAQQPVSINLTQKDGLSGIEFYGVLEDKKGFIWFASKKGMFCYNGKEFKHFYHPKQRGLSVFNLLLDNKGRVWFHNISGQIFYIENNEIHLFTDLLSEIGARGGSSLFSFRIIEDSLYVFLYGTVYKINFYDKKIVKFKNNREKLRILTVFRKNDTLFYLNREALSKKQYTLSIAPFEKKDLNKVIVNDKYHPSFFHYSVNNRHFITITNDENKSFDSYAIQNNKLVKINLFPKNYNFERVYNLKVINNLVWLCSSKGVYKFEFINNKLKLKSFYFPNNSISDVIKDANDNYWITSLQNGVFVIPNIELKKNELKKNIGTITCLEKVNNSHIFYTTTKGWICEYDLNKKTNKYYKLKNNSEIPTIAFLKKQHVLLISTQSKNSFIFDLKSKKIKSLQDQVINGVKSMSKINDNKILLVNYSSAVEYSIDNNLNFKAIDKKYRGKRGFTTLFDASNKQKYVGYLDELVAYDSLHNPKSISFNNKNIITTSLTKANDLVWAATFKDGVLGIKNGNVVKSYNVNNGLLSNQITLVRADNKNLWIVTNKGIQVIDTETNKTKQFTEKDGIESYNIIDIKFTNNTVWFASDLGVFSGDKRKIIKKIKEPKPYFTSVSVNDKKVPLKSVYNLSYDENRVEIGFNTNIFQAKKNIKYQYKIKGLNKEWLNISNNQNNVIITGLSQGKYTFKLRAINDTKISDVQKIDFNIDGVFYKQWWFLTLSLLTIVSLIVFYFKNRLKKQEKEQKIKYELQENEYEKIALKLENLRSQMNPHFVFNALNSIQDYIIHNQKDLAGDYLGKFADLIRLYLDQSSKKTISLEEEIETLDRYLELEKLRFEEKLDYSIHVAKEIVEEAIEIPTMLIQPYVENAIKHGLLHKRGRGNLVVDFSLNTTSSYLTCIIFDDGVGRKKATKFNQNKIKKHAPFATKANLDRLHLLNYNKKRKITVTIEDLIPSNLLNEDTGTKVTVLIPV